MNEHAQEQKTENIFGALALVIADNLLHAAQNHMTLSAPAAAIALVSHLPNMNISQLSRALGLSHAATVRLVDRLENEGFLIRLQAENDARYVALKLSTNGEDLAQGILASRQNTLKNALASLSPSEQEILAHLAEKMLTALVKNEDHAIEICRLCDPSICYDCPVTTEIIRRETSES